MRAREWVRVCGVVAFACGMLCLPSTAASPKQLTSLFSWLAGSGALLHVAAACILAGAGLFAISFLGDRE
jgi:hypothetical protein